MASASEAVSAAPELVAQSFGGNTLERTIAARRDTARVTFIASLEQLMSSPLQVNRVGRHAHLSFVQQHRTLFPTRSRLHGCCLCWVGAYACAQGRTCRAPPRSLLP